MAALMGIALLVLLVQDIPLSNYLRQVETDRLVTSLERDAFVLAGRSEETLETPPASADAAGSAAAAAALTTAARGYRDSGGARVVIVNAGGVAVVTSDDDQSIVGDSYASRPEIMGALGGQITSGHRYSDTLKIDLLVYLSRDAGAVHRRADILHDVWETTWHGTTKTLDAHVAAIRKKLGHPGWIDSVRGVGFRFGVPE